MRKTGFKILLAGMLAMTLLATGCIKEETSIGKFGAVTNGIYLYSDLAVQDSTVEEFDTKKYDLAEYRKLLDEEVKAYNTANEFKPGDKELRKDYEPDYVTPVTVVKCEVSGGKIRQQLLYANATDYANYRKENISEPAESENGFTFTVGTLAKVDPAILPAIFVAPSGNAVNVQELCVSSSAAKYRYVICDFEALLYGDGDLVCYTKNATYDADNLCVQVKGGEKVIAIFK